MSLSFSHPHDHNNPTTYHVTSTITHSGTDKYCPYYMYRDNILDTKKRPNVDVQWDMKNEIYEHLTYIITYVISNLPFIVCSALAQLFVREANMPLNWCIINLSNPYRLGPSSVSDTVLYSGNTLNIWGFNAPLYLYCSELPLPN